MALVLGNPAKMPIHLGVLLLIFVVMAFWDRNNLKKERRLLPIGILMIAFGFFWLRMGSNWAFIANIFLWALYTISKRKLLITVAEDAVIYPSFPKKQIPWSQLNQVILKDGVLTIDCKNNKLYQHDIQNSEDLVNEADFNDFCKNQLKQGSFLTEKTFRN